MDFHILIVTLVMIVLDIVFGFVSEVKHVKDF